MVHADAVESQILVFAQALATGQVPENTTKRLSENGVLVGRVENGSFIEAADGNALMRNGEVITAGEFADTVNRDAGLYDAFTKATYLPAAYYYDEAAKEVFRKIGTGRNNYSAGESFEETTSKLMGEGSNISINNVELVKKEVDGETTTELASVGQNAASGQDAMKLVTEVGDKNRAANQTLATLNAADTLAVADTVSQEQRASLFFLAFMENISKMKYGNGNDSQINEAMNRLYEVKKSEVVDVKTGEVITVEGSMMDSPSLAAILSEGRLETSRVDNYSTDRILRTVENQLGEKASGATFEGTVGSFNNKKTGVVGRFLTDGSEDANAAALQTVVPTVEKSLVNNSFSTTQGVSGGELLVQGGSKCC